ncbi:DUF4333 domain-containing protein [Pseudonocardia lacus]|uniref:DUF4333 domain-containing protein n=1 Tax=Pseudonocardia lacus TaxID=2835865 RepID=UPI001BDD16F1|nr:DUF4333 domain-containing protein [Pseudonocardia lacus]
MHPTTTPDPTPMPGPGGPRPPSAFAPAHRVPPLAGPHPVPPPPVARRSRAGVVWAVVGGLVALLGAAGGVLALLGFFSPSVARADVAAGISEQLGERGVVASAVDCPQDLPAEVGAEVRCTYTVDGRAVGAVARVSSVRGDQVVFDTTSDAPLVAPQDVATAVDEHVGTLGHDVDGGADCPGALIGETGRSVRCEFAVGGQPVDAVVTVSAVTAAEVEFDIALQARAVARDVVEQDVAYLIAQEYGAVVDSADCDGGLDPEVGASTLCTVTGGGDRLDLRVAVAALEDGLVVYDLQSV